MPLDDDRSRDEREDDRSETARLMPLLLCDPLFQRDMLELAKRHLARLGHLHTEPRP